MRLLEKVTLRFESETRLPRGQGREIRSKPEWQPWRGPGVAGNRCPQGGKRPISSQITAVNRKNGVLPSRIGRLASYDPRRPAAQTGSSLATAAAGKKGKSW